MTIGHFEETEGPGHGPSVPDIDLEELLGKGMTGAVYKGTTNVGQTVAVKLLHPQLASDDNVVESFVRERDIFGELAHENVVAIEDLVVGQGLLAIIMEYVNGGTLRKLIDQERLSPRDATSLIADVANGLVAVHKAGIVHRDLKPENILLHTDDVSETTTPKIADFGLSRLVGSSGVKLSSSGGTPLYMSPESVLRDKVGAPADVYALGAVLFELLSGKPPFSGDEPMPIMMAHAQTNPPRLSGLPIDLVELVDSMLAKEPSQRPTAVEVRRRLLNIAPDLEDLSSNAVSIETTDSADPRATIHRSIDPGNRLVKIGAGAAALLIVTIGALLLTKPWQRDTSDAGTVAAPEVRQPDSLEAAGGPSAESQQGDTAGSEGGTGRFSLAAEDPNSDDTPTADEDLNSDDTPTADEDPSSDDTPTADEDPSSDETPTADEDPTTDKDPTAPRTPTTAEDRSTTATEAPATTKAPAATKTEAPGTTEASTTTKAPATTEAPTTTETPTTPTTADPCLFTVPSVIGLTVQEAAAVASSYGLFNSTQRLILSEESNSFDWDDTVFETGQIVGQIPTAGSVANDNCTNGPVLMGYTVARAAFTSP